MKKYGFIISLLLLLAALPAAAHEPRDGRVGRAEVRFLEGMIDHHQMALDMANDCLAKAVTASVRELCQNIIDAQSAEIKTMQGWLKDWYSIDYQPMSMAGVSGGMGMMDGMMSMMPGMMNGMMGMMMDGSMNCTTSDGVMVCVMIRRMDEMGMGMMGGEHEGEDHDQHGGMGMMPGQPGDMPMMDGHQGDDHGAHQGGMMAGLDELEGVEYEIAWLEAMIDHHDDALTMSRRILQRGEHEDLLRLAQQIIADQTAEIEQMEAMIEALSAL